MRSARIVTAIVAAAVLATAGWRVAAQGPLPLEPIKDRGQSITGAFEGWYKNADGTYSLLVGYMNRNRVETIDIPVGPNNRIEPGGPDMGQPTHFLPRRAWGVFVIKVPADFGKKRLTWTLTANGQTTTVPMHIDPLWVVEPLKDAGLGNTPPVVRFTQDGPPQQGPPEKISGTYTATVGSPLPLDVWATDDGIRAPEVRERPGPPVTLFWSMQRGPADVKFEKDRPEMDVKNSGKATTTATFSAPGDYILRLQANDASGVGGGGFQCCWTNAHVKVTVSSGAQTR
jgi:hypothetical protein